MTETPSLTKGRLRLNTDLAERVRAQHSWVGVALVAVLWVIYLFYTERSLEVGLLLAAGTLNSLVPAALRVIPPLRQLHPRWREAAATASAIVNLVLVAAAIPYLSPVYAGILYALFILLTLVQGADRGAMATAAVAGAALVAFSLGTGLQGSGDLARFLVLAVAGAAAVRTAIGRRSTLAAVDSTARLAEVLSRPSQPEEVVSAALDEIRQVVRSDNASVMLIEGEEFRIAAAAGASGPTGAPRLALDQGVAGRVALTAEGAIIHDTRRDPRFSTRPGLPVRSLICVPLAAEERVLGVINISSERPYAFQHEDLEVATRVGRLAGHALQAARRQRENEVRAATLAAVVRFGAQLVDETSVEGVCNVAVRIIADQGRFDRVAVYLAEGGRLLLRATNAPSAVVLNLTAGVGARAFRERRLIRVDALADDPEELAAPGAERISRLAVPLEWSGQMLGVIEIDRVHGTFNRLDEEALAVMATEVAAAVRSARAVQGERDRTAHLLAVIHTLKEVNAELDLDDLLHRIVDRSIAAVSGAEAGSLVVREGDHFEFRAAVGFDLHALRQARLPLLGPPGQPLRPGEIQHVTGPIHQRWPPLDPDSQAILERYGRLDEIRASILVPIYVDGEVYGRLNLNSFTRHDAFQKVDEDLIRLFSEQAGVAIKNASLHSELQRMALADPLTGLPNRRLFDAEFSRLLAQARRSGSPLALLVMDMDHFKRVNDELGHEAGDRALAIVAGAMRGTLRRSDLFARYGGEEFLAALPDADKEGAERAAQTMMRAVAEARLDEHPGVRFSVSVGAACYPEDGETFQALYRVADAAMFETKSQHQDRARIKSRPRRP